MWKEQEKWLYRKLSLREPIIAHQKVLFLALSFFSTKERRGRLKKKMQGLII
jgi:hypothetical protein